MDAAPAPAHVSFPIPSPHACVLCGINRNVASTHFPCARTMGLRATLCFSCLIQRFDIFVSTADEPPLSKVDLTYLQLYGRCSVSVLRRHLSQAKRKNRLNDHGDAHGLSAIRRSRYDKLDDTYLQMLDFEERQFLLLYRRALALQNLNPQEQLVYWFLFDIWLNSNKVQIPPLEEGLSAPPVSPLKRRRLADLNRRTAERVVRQGKIHDALARLAAVAAAPPSEPDHISETESETDCFGLHIDHGNQEVFQNTVPNPYAHVFDL